jgi:hypothetical protein
MPLVELGTTFIQLASLIYIYSHDEGLLSNYFEKNNACISVRKNRFLYIFNVYALMIVKIIDNSFV